MATEKTPEVPVALLSPTVVQEVVPCFLYRKPLSRISPVAPEKEPCRVAPAELISSVPPVTTVDVACGVVSLQLFE